MPRGFVKDTAFPDCAIALATSRSHFMMSFELSNMLPSSCSVSCTRTTRKQSNFLSFLWRSEIHLAYMKTSIQVLGPKLHARVSKRVRGIQLMCSVLQSFLQEMPGLKDSIKVEIDRGHDVKMTGYGRHEH